MTAVGVIGLGAMGAPIARRFLDAGHEVLVWNRTPGKAEALVSDGALAAVSPADLARRAEVTVTMLADPAALVDVTEGPDGIAAGRPPTMIEMSTMGPKAIARLRDVLPTDTDLLDAPVLGSTSEADAGRLLVFAGGPGDLLERWTPLLSVLGRVLHAGELGRGAAAKLVANSTLLSVLTTLGEALALADRLGLAREVAFEVLAATPLGSQAERRREAVQSGEFPHRFSLALALKDADLIVGEGAAAGIELHVAAAARRWLEDAVDAGLGSEDYSAVLAHILEGRPAG